MKKLLPILLLLLPICFIGCNSPASSGKIVWKDINGQKTVFLDNTSSDKKITFVVDMSQIDGTGKPFDLRTEATVGPKEEFEFWSRSITKVEIVAAYESKLP